MKKPKTQTYTIGSLQITATSLADAQTKARIISSFNIGMGFRL